MDKIEKIRAEIDRRYNEYSAKKKTDDFIYYSGMADALGLFEQFLDTLEEEPDKSLEEAEDEYTQKMLESWRFDSTGCRPPRESFKAGAKWQKEQMMKDVVEGTVCIIRHTPPFVSVQIPIEKWMNVDVSIGDKVWLLDAKED